MAETLTQPKTGTAIGIPEQTKWCSIEEVEKFEKCILKNYIRKDKKDSKEFFYKVIGLHPNQPAVSYKTNVENVDIPSSENFLVSFEVQKYYRNKFTKTTVRDNQNPQMSSEAQVNLQVDGHEMRGGRWVCVDQTASFFKDAREFLKEFEIDDTE